MYKLKKSNSTSFNLALDLVEDGKYIQIEDIKKSQLPPNVIGQFVAFIFAFMYIMKGDQYLHLRFKYGFKSDLKSLRRKL